MEQRVLVVYRDLPELGPYQTALYEAGIEPTLLPADGPISLEGFGGLFLTGGGDVNPRMYGESPRPETEEPDDERDSLEAALIGEALDRDLPLLAICRGLQIWNVQQGGTLVQHLDPAQRHQTKTEDRGLAAHTIAIEHGTLLSSIAASGTWHVNSRHHQAIAKLGTGLRVSARSCDDGIVEAVEMPGKRFALGVQWHPEDQVFRYPEQLRLFTSFARAVS